MIDFRYHLISIVAVLLALSIGIVLGSGVVGGPLLEDLQDRADRIRRINAELREESASRQSRIDELEDFLDNAEPYVLNGTLVGEEVVLFELPGVSNSVTEELRSSVGLADGALVTRIEFTDKIELSDEIERDELALVLSSVSSSPEDLRVEMATQLGARSAAAADQRDPGGASAAAADQRLQGLLDELEDSEFLTVERTEGEDAVPGDAIFLVVAGSEDPPFEMGEMITELALELVEVGATTLVGEASGSQAEILASIIDDGTAEQAIATSDGIDTIIGRVAAVLGLDLASEGEVGHYGIGPTASEMIPSFPGG